MALKLKNRHSFLRYFTFRTSFWFYKVPIYSNKSQYSQIRKNKDWRDGSVNVSHIVSLSAILKKNKKNKTNFFFLPQRCCNTACIFCVFPTGLLVLRVSSCYRLGVSVALVHSWISMWLWEQIRGCLPLPPELFKLVWFSPRWSD